MLGGMDMPIKRDYLHVARPVKRAAKARPVIVIDAGHGWLPDPDDATRAVLDPGAVYEPTLDAGARAGERQLEEYRLNEALAHDLGRVLGAHGFEVHYTNLDAEGMPLWGPDHFPATRVQSRFDVAHGLADSGRHVVAYLSVHHDSGRACRQHGAAIAAHIASPPAARTLGQMIARHLHQLRGPDDDLPHEPQVSNASYYREAHIHKFKSPADETHIAAFDPAAWEELLPHSTNIIRPGAHPPIVTRGLGAIPAVLIERGVMWHAGDRRKMVDPGANRLFAHAVADAVSGYYDARCREDAALPRRGYGCAR